MHSFVSGLLYSSIIGSVLIIIVMLIRIMFFRKSSHWVCCLLWGLVAIRLIFPVSLEIRIDSETNTSNFFLELDNSINKVISFDNRNRHSDIVSEDRLLASGFPAEGFAAQHDLIEETALLSRDSNDAFFLGWFSLIWSIPFVSMLLYSIAFTIIMRKRLLDATLLEPGIKQTDQIKTAIVFGLIHPTAFIPYDLTIEDRAYVIAHEKAHISRGDHLWKMISFLILSLHWFNPFVWLAYVLLTRDIEYACDEKIVSQIGIIGIKEYSVALLKYSVQDMHLSRFPGFGEANVKTRIKKITSYKKPSHKKEIIVIILIGIFLVFLGLSLIKPISGIETEGAILHEPDDANSNTPLDSTTAMGIQTTSIQDDGFYSAIYNYTCKIISVMDKDSNLSFSVNDFDSINGYIVGKVMAWRRDSYNNLFHEGITNVRFDSVEILDVADRKDYGEATVIVNYRYDFNHRSSASCCCKYTIVYHREGERVLCTDILTSDDDEVMMIIEGIEHTDKEWGSIEAQKQYVDDVISEWYKGLPSE